MFACITHRALTNVFAFCFSGIDRRSFIVDRNVMWWLMLECLVRSERPPALAKHLASEPCMAFTFLPLNLALVSAVCDARRRAQIVGERGDHNTVCTGFLSAKSWDGALASTISPLPPMICEPEASVGGGRLHGVGAPFSDGCLTPE